VQRLRLPFVLGLAGVIAATAAVSAQDAQVKQRHLVVPHDVLVQIERLLDETVTRDLARQISRDVSQSMSEFTRRFGRLPFLDAADQQDFKAQAVDKETHKLAIGATGALELKNVVGDITVKAGSGRDATVEIVRTSRGRTDADAKLGLERVKVDVVTRGDRSSVTTVYPNEQQRGRPAYSVSTTYVVSMPAGARLEAHSIAGNIRVAGVRGDIQADTISGTLDISNAARITNARTVNGKLTLTGIDSDGAVECGTMNGTVVLTDVKARRLNVNVISGDIVAKNIQVGGADVGSMSGDIDFSGPVTAAGRYAFKTHSGEIRLMLAGGYEFEGRSFSGDVRGEPGLSLTRSTGMREITRGTIGGGGAFVEATTFSGSVTVGRTK
jgi:hypothetical protein